MRARILLAVLILSGAVGLTRADDKPLDRAELDKRIVRIVYESALLGTEIFNRGGHGECARLYQGTLSAVVPMLDHRPKLQTDAQQRIERAKGLNKAAEAAIEMRAALDEIQNTIAPPIKKEPALEPKDTKEPKTTQEPKDTKKVLWDRLGGESVVKAVVHDFALAALEDPKVNFTRGGKYKPSAAALEKSIVDMISDVSGGPFKYSGKSMKEAHKGMAITDAEFDALAVHLVASLKKFKVADPEIAELVKVVAGTREAIVEKAPAPTEKGTKP
ncbi:group 1 truncated hemoglobin [Gemmata sp. JC717]|uniref:Group 1 truncated hemoglobin n=1 Tax=Gemmata algarum TaxID=2975278 RepID=A0ABU5F7A8_9BACT|nr:group 1 truncated hemoglobin [Gemmata algarum]MDY3554115.1 group 1 truncated hemoglobin [Gemmata algarum]MDY3563221.1 group 1 truncated hemoglobin [Gemmata algarum]